jgi:hypothetical protein
LKKLSFIKNILIIARMVKLLWHRSMIKYLYFLNNFYKQLWLNLHWHDHHW